MWPAKHLQVALPTCGLHRNITEVLSTDAGLGPSPLRLAGRAGAIAFGCSLSHRFRSGHGRPCWGPRGGFLRPGEQGVRCQHNHVPSGTGQMGETEVAAYGIDLGTSYSCVATVDETGRAVVLKSAIGEDTTPSVVYFESSDSVVVGLAAKNTALLAPELVASRIMRLMGD